MKNFLIVLLPISWLAGCSPAPVDTQSEKEAVLQTSRNWNQAAASRNLDSTLSYWTDDALVLSAGQPPLEGKTAIRHMVAAGFADPGFSISWDPQKAEVSKCGDMAYLVEDSRISTKDSAGNSQLQKFKTITIWRKQADGSWKAVVDAMTPVPQ